MVLVSHVVLTAKSPVNKRVIHFDIYGAKIYFAKLSCHLLEMCGSGEEFPSVEAKDCHEIILVVVTAGDDDGGGVGAANDDGDEKKDGEEEEEYGSGDIDNGDEDDDHGDEGDEDDIDDVISEPIIQRLCLFSTENPQGFEHDL